jgi:hypothetical protein
MPLTLSERDDLRTRLEVVIGEYAAASQRSEAVAKVHGVLDRVAVVAETPAETPEPTET